MNLICMWMKTHFHMKGWAPRLGLKKRLKVIRKWPIEQLAALQTTPCHALYISMSEDWWLKAWQKISITSDSHHIWTVKWPHNYLTAGCFWALFVLFPPRKNFVNLYNYYASERNGGHCGEMFYLPKIRAKCCFLTTHCRCKGHYCARLEGTYMKC